MIRTLLLSLWLLAATAGAEWTPAATTLMTEWGRSVTPANAWREYPRPQLQREQWTDLNGLWAYAITPKGAEQPAQWQGEILVPFCPESALSGVGRLLEPTETLWYRRALPEPKTGLRTILNFEAVDYEMTAWVNGQQVGTHRGGHTAFSFDITDALRPSGENELIVRVDDATMGYQLHGKQSLQNQGIWYTRVSGIWQTVWLEEVPPNHIVSQDFECHPTTGTIELVTSLASPLKPGAGLKFRGRAFFKGQPVGEATETAFGHLTFKIAQPQLWTPETPHLYDLEVQLLDDDGKVIDQVKSYTAFRTFGKAKDAEGHWRFTLNGKPVFHWGPLDQGWWPDGLLTPPSEKAMASDIEFLKAAGFNMIRKHIKVEPRRFYYDCDRLGMLVWQDQVSAGSGRAKDNPPISPEWSKLQPDPQDAVWPEEAHQQWVTEYQRMIQQLHSAVCISVWIPFNERWGQHRTLEVAGLARELDHTRLIDLATGGNFFPDGDVADLHAYPMPDFPTEEPRFKDYVQVVGEFGGLGLPIKGHVWKPNGATFSYGKDKPQNLDDLKAKYHQAIETLAALKKKGVAGGVYTQTTDVETEINGLRTYDRVDKLDPAWLKAQAQLLFAE